MRRPDTAKRPSLPEVARPRSGAVARWVSVRHMGKLLSTFNCVINCLVCSCNSAQKFQNLDEDGTCMVPWPVSAYAIHG